MIAIGSIFNSVVEKTSKLASTFNEYGTLTPPTHFVQSGNVTIYTFASETHRTNETIPQGACLYKTGRRMDDFRQFTLNNSGREAAKFWLKNGPQITNFNSNYSCNTAEFQDSNTPSTSQLSNPLQPSDSLAPFTHKITASALKVRTGPGTEYPESKPSLPQGTCISVVEQAANGWLKTQFKVKDGGTGYFFVSGNPNYVTRLGPNPNC